MKIYIISTPREIKHTFRWSRDGSVIIVTRPGAEVQFPPFTSDVSPFKRSQTGSEAHPTPKLTDKCRRFYSCVRSPGVKSTSHLQHLTSRIRICKVKCPRYKPGCGPEGGRGIALLFHDHGIRRGWVVSSTLQPYFAPGKDPLPIVQETGWAPGPVWTGGISRPTGSLSPNRPARSSVAIPTELPGLRIRICEVINLRPLCLHDLHLNLMEVIVLNEGMWDGLFRIPVFWPNALKYFTT